MWGFFVLSTAGNIKNLPALPVGTIPPGKELIIFFRHTKSKHPELDGPYNGPFNTNLL
jgi:hypothetical protein